MKKNGFTLVEMLVVVGLIAIVSTSITLSMLSMYNNQKVTLANDEIENVENAACTYAEINELRSSCTDQNNCETTVAITELISNGYLDKDIDLDYYVQVLYDNGEITNETVNTYVTIKWTDGLKSCSFVS